MNKEKVQNSDSKSPKLCQAPSKECHKDTKLIHTRRYDIIDLLMVSIYNAIVFAAGLGLGWVLWFKQTTDAAL